MFEQIRDRWGHLCVRWAIGELPEDRWRNEPGPSFFFFRKQSDWPELRVWLKLTCLTSPRCVQVRSRHQPIAEQRPVSAGHVTKRQVWLHFCFRGRSMFFHLFIKDKLLSVQAQDLHPHLHFTAAALRSVFLFTSTADYCSHISY